MFNNGDLTVDLTRRLVTAQGRDVKLSNKEWGILKLLVMNAGKVLRALFPFCSRKTLLPRVFHQEPAPCPFKTHPFT